MIINLFITFYLQISDNKINMSIKDSNSPKMNEKEKLYLVSTFFCNNYAKANKLYT